MSAIAVLPWTSLAAAVLVGLAIWCLLRDRARSARWLAAGFLILATGFLVIPFTLI